MNATAHCRLRFLSLSFCALTCLIGCKGSGSSDLLERELRRQEDCIYQLEGELDNACDALDASRRENESLKKELSGGDKGAGGQFAPSVTLPPTITGPGSQPGSDPLHDTPKFKLPRGKKPDTEAPKFEEAPRFNSPTTEQAPKFDASELDEPQPLFKSSSHSSDRQEGLTDDARRIARLALNRQLTGGWNPDGRHGDEGLFVAFEPRDAANKLVKAVGDVSIVALDPAQTGAGARVGRWDFTTDEAAAMFRQGLMARGLQFELPWPSSPPKNRDLRLFVRLTTPDGRKVETDSRIRITPYDQESKNWTPRMTDKEESPKPAAAGPEFPASHTEPLPKAAPRPKWSPDR